MKLVQFLLKTGGKGQRVGVLHAEEDVVCDLTSALGLQSVIDFMKMDKAFHECIPNLLMKNRNYQLGLEDIELLAPITQPSKILCIGMNYKDHCQEQNKPIPEQPVVFNKFPSCILSPNQSISYPQMTNQLDWEVELALVIGQKGYDIPLEKAQEHIFGFTIALDVTARDLMKKNGGQCLLGKSMDGFCPLGPYLITYDEVSDPHQLRLICQVNQETKQDSNTRQMIFDTNEIVAWCSKFCTLVPGDVILTGSPPGAGCFKKPPQFLQKGDVIECSIEKIGSMTNRIF